MESNKRNTEDDRTSRQSISMRFSSISQRSMSLKNASRTFSSGIGLRESSAPKLPPDDLDGLAPASMLAVRNDPTETEFFTRLLIAGSFLGDANSIANYIRSLLLSVTTKDETSGLMLVQSRSVINLVETTPTNALSLMERMKQDGDKCPLSSVRIIALSEACPARIFSSWDSRKVTLPKEATVDLASENETNAASECYNNLLLLGRQLNEQELSQADLDSALDNLKQYYSELLPSNERVQALAESEAFFDLNDFVQTYASPVTSSQIADLTWPASSLRGDLFFS